MPRRNNLVPRRLRLGYAYVVADLIHVGHVKFLESCTALCDRLIVGVLTNEAVLERKPQPIIPFVDRLRMVRALNCVDAAVTQETYSPLPNVVAIQANILFESTSHSFEGIEEARIALSRHGGQVIVLPYYPACSTSAIVKRIKNVLA